MSQSQNVFNLGQQLQFTASVSGGVSPYSYSWNFGDGTTSTSNPATHTYSETGIYTVKVTVTDAIGDTASASVTVTIQATPSLTLTVENVATYNGNYYIVEGNTIGAVAVLSYEGTPLSGQTIDFYANGTQIGSATTDSSGRAEIGINTSSTGTVQIYATFAGTGGYNSAQSNTVTVYVVAPLSVSVSVS